MVKYTRLWETMQRKGISQYRLIKTYGISNGQLNRLRKNLYISTHTVETLCRILDCRVEDVMEIVFDESDELLWSPGLEEAITTPSERFIGTINPLVNVPFVIFEKLTIIKENIETKIPINVRILAYI